MITIKTLLKNIQSQYPEAILPRFEIEIILSKLAHLSRAEIIAFPEKNIQASIATLFYTCCARRAQGEPIAYLFSSRDFWDLALEVNETVLIPRHETEHLITYCVEKHGKRKDLSCIDLGTGSGAIALSLASACPGWHIIAVDKSFLALEVARKNRDKYGFSTVEFVCSDWLSALGEKKFDLIISNPPYLSKTDPHLLQGDLKYEPLSALIADKGGLADLSTIISQSILHLKPGGELILEHGCEQGEGVRQLLIAALFTDVKTYLDYANLERFTVASYSACGRP